MSAFFIGFGVLVKGHANIYDLVRGIKGMQKNTLNNLIIKDMCAALTSHVQRNGIYLT